MNFHNIIELGIESEMEFYQKREARMVNLFAVITLFGLLIGVSSVFFLSGSYPAFTVVFSCVASLFILILNKKSYYNIATYFFVISININLFIINQQYKDSAENALYYFPIIFCVALIHNPFKSYFRTILFFCFITLSFILAKTLSVTSLKINNITETDNYYLSIYNYIISLFVTIVIVYLVLKLINRQSNETLFLLKKEQETQLVINQSLIEKETLLAEIQHRVKNNLAIITGLLNLQTEKAPFEIS